ncbi:unnamed protein product, partial [Closterium sp. NIES-54]
NPVSPAADSSLSKDESTPEENTTDDPCTDCADASILAGCDEPRRSRTRGSMVTTRAKRVIVRLRAWNPLVGRVLGPLSARCLASANPRRGSSGVAVARASSAEENAAREQAENEAGVAEKRVRLGFIGAGQMAEALARGLSAAFEAAQ